MKLFVSTLIAFSMMTSAALAKPEKYDLENYLRFLNRIEANVGNYGTLFAGCPDRTRQVTFRGDALVVIVDKCTADKITKDPQLKEKFFKQLSVLSQEIEIYYLKTIIVKVKGGADLGVIKVEPLYYFSPADTAKVQAPLATDLNRFRYLVQDINSSGGACPMQDQFCSSGVMDVNTVGAAVVVTVDSDFGKQLNYIPLAERVDYFKKFAFYWNIVVDNKYDTTVKLRVQNAGTLGAINTETLHYILPNPKTAYRGTGNPRDF